MKDVDCQIPLIFSFFHLVHSLQKEVTKPKLPALVQTIFPV